VANQLGGKVLRIGSAPAVATGENLVPTFERLGDNMTCPIDIFVTRARARESEIREMTGMVCKAFKRC
jgi:hypothetical protein